MKSSEIAKNGGRRRGRTMEEVNPTKIYYEHIYKYQCIPLYSYNKLKKKVKKVNRVNVLSIQE
jgi:hypothetical protein